MKSVDCWKHAKILSILILLSACSSNSNNNNDNISIDTVGNISVHRVSSENNLKLVLIPNAPTSFWNLVRNGLNKFESEFSAKVELKYPPTGKVTEQNQLLEDLIIQGYHGVAISVIAPKDQVRELNKACEKLNVITTDSDSPDSNRIAFVGPKQFDAGKAAGVEISRILPDGGEIALFVGDLSAENAVERINGIKEIISDKNIKIVSMKEDGTDLTRARANVEDVINAYPNISCLVGLWSYNGPAIAQALIASKKNGKIQAVTFDEEDGTLEAIDNGVIESTIVLTPFEYGYESAKLLYNLALNGKDSIPSNNWLDTGFSTVNKSNLNQFRVKLNAQRDWK
tara:strand:+ start:192 stop:1217 length:1026 start_codon:yes stop_codon:yes gene_type:complete